MRSPICTTLELIAILRLRSVLIVLRLIRLAVYRVVGLLVQEVRHDLWRLRWQKILDMWIGNVRWIRQRVI